MSTSIINGLLALLIGLAAGALLVLILDLKWWRTRVQAAVGERNKAQAMIQVLQARLQRAERGQWIAHKDLRALRHDFDEQENQLRRRDSEGQTMQTELQAARAEVTRLNEDLNRVNNHIGEMRRQIQSRQNDLQTAVAQNNLLQANTEKYSADLEAARSENQQICRRLAVMEVEMKHLQRELAEADEKDARVNALKTENDALVGQLNKAEIRMGELKAQVDGALYQLTETQFLRKKLAEMESKLKLAEKQAVLLQGKFSTMQHTFDHTGKNQLQLIRGIGPAYARRLNEAGVNSLADLAKCTSEQITEILQPQKWQNIQPHEWIEEAQALTIRIGNGDTA